MRVPLAQGQLWGGFSFLPFEFICANLAVDYDYQ